MPCGVMVWVMVSQPFASHLRAFTKNFLVVFPSVHGVAASYAIRNTRDCVLNADFNKFFGIALMLDGLFWDSGVGQISQQEYAILQKTAAGKALIAAFGLTNIAVLARGMMGGTRYGQRRFSHAANPGSLKILCYNLLYTGLLYRILY
ncbi:hypothetical protein GGI43DRAFT_419406 [Trichoderma evansii]